MSLADPLDQDLWQGDAGVCKNNQFLPLERQGVRTHCQASAAPWWQHLGSSPPRDSPACSQGVQEGQAPTHDIPWGSGDPVRLYPAPLPHYLLGSLSRRTEESIREEKAQTGGGLHFAACRLHDLEQAISSVLGGRPQPRLDKSLRSQLRVRVSFGEHLEFLSLGPADMWVGLIPVLESPWAWEGLERPSWPHPVTQQ